MMNITSSKAIILGKDMFPILSKSEKLKNELSLWTKQANRITDENIKKKIFDNISLIRKLADEIDTAHDSNYLGQIRPQLTDELRKKLNSSRKEIQQIIKLHLDV